MSVEERDPRDTLPHIIVCPNTMGGATVSIDVGGGTHVCARMDGDTARELAAKLLECVEESERIAERGLPS